VPVRDLETILETLGDHSARTKDADLLTEHVRVALARAICRQWVDENDRLPCLMLEAGLEEMIAGHVESSAVAAAVGLAGGSAAAGGASGAGGAGSAGSLSSGGGGGGGAINAMPPATQQRIGHEIARYATALARDGRPPVVLCTPQVRSAVRKLVEPVAPQVAVLSLSEVVADVTPDVIGVVGDEGAGEEAGLGDDGIVVEDGRI
jgi:flagellar biosynthesis protein FlhA